MSYQQRPQQAPRRDGGGIPEDYVSPIVRLGILRLDEPDIEQPHYTVEPAADHIPAPFLAGTEWVVVATIRTRGGHVLARAWKEVPLTVQRWEGQGQSRRKVDVPFAMTPDALPPLQTQALGRALKMLGLPDQLDDFRGLVAYRRRVKEIELLGSTAGALPPGKLDQTDDEIVGALTRAASSATRDVDVPAGVDPDTGEIVVPPEETHVEPAPVHQFASVGGTPMPHREPDTSDLPTRLGMTRSAALIAARNVAVGLGLDPPSVLDDSLDPRITEALLASAGG